MVAAEALKWGSIEHDSLPHISSRQYNRKSSRLPIVLAVVLLVWGETRRRGGGGANFPQKPVAQERERERERGRLCI